MNRKSVIMIQSYYFLDYYAEEGDPQPIGGGRRYLRDIGKLFYDIGYKVIYIQKSHKNFKMQFEDWAEVYGVASPLGSKGDISFTKKAFQFTKEADLICYGNMEDSFPYVRENSFAIQHGIWWDYKLPFLKRKIQEKRVKFVASKVKFVICVDTNFINWYRTNWPEDKEIYDKFFYIPNYADTVNFKSTLSNNRKDENTPILLFPRRFEIKRGYQIFIEMCSILKDRGYQFKVELVGSGRQNEDHEIKTKLDRLGIHYNIEKADFDEMYKFYQRAYLTFVPTLWSEGTSLSAIESIISGCPVISTDVGGLGNIIVPGFNGEIVTASANHFAEVTAKLLDDKSKRDELSTNCLTMRDAFSKARWENDIVNLVEKHTRVTEL